MTAASYQKLHEEIEWLRQMDDQETRAEYLLELAARFTPPDPARISAPYPEANRIPGCESGVFLFCNENSQGGTEFFYAIENPHGISAKALAVLLTENLSGANAEDFRKLNPDMVRDVFGAALSLGKDQGLRNMILATRRGAGSGGGGRGDEPEGKHRCRAVRRSIR